MNILAPLQYAKGERDASTMTNGVDSWMSKWALTEDGMTFSQEESRVALRELETLVQEFFSDMKW